MEPIIHRHLRVFRYEASVLNPEKPADIAYVRHENATNLGADAKQPIVCLKCLIDSPAPSRWRS